MSDQKYYLEILPFEELVALHKEGKLSDYAEAKTREFISLCEPKGQQAHKLSSLSMQISSIRAKYPSGLRAYLEINKLLHKHHEDFLDDMLAITEKNKARACSSTDSGKVIAFPAS